MCPPGYVNKHRASHSIDYDTTNFVEGETTGRRGETIIGAHDLVSGCEDFNECVRWAQDTNTGGDSDSNKRQRWSDQACGFHLMQDSSSVVEEGRRNQSTAASSCINTLGGYWCQCPSSAGSATLFQEHGALSWSWDADTDFSSLLHSASSFDAAFGADSDNTDNTLPLWISFFNSTSAAAYPWLSLVHPHCQLLPSDSPAALVSFLLPGLLLPAPGSGVMGTTGKMVPTQRWAVLTSLLLDVVRVLEISLESLADVTVENLWLDSSVSLSSSSTSVGKKEKEEEEKEDEEGQEDKETEIRVVPIGAAGESSPAVQGGEEEAAAFHSLVPALHVRFILTTANIPVAEEVSPWDPKRRPLSVLVEAIGEMVLNTESSWYKDRTTTGILTLSGSLVGWLVGVFGFLFVTPCTPT